MSIIYLTAFITAACMKTEKSSLIEPSSEKTHSQSYSLEQFDFSNTHINGSLAENLLIDADITPITVYDKKLNQYHIKNAALIDASCEEYIQAINECYGTNIEILPDMYQTEIFLVSDYALCERSSFCKYTAGNNEFSDKYLIMEMLFSQYPLYSNTDDTNIINEELEKFKNYFQKFVDYPFSDSYICIHTNSNFYQKVPVEEFKKRFLGKQLTLSALYTDGTLEFGTLTVPTQYPSSNQILFATPAGLAVALTTDGGPQIFRRQYTKKGVVAVKTEFGSHQTLAHKEGSKWVLNEIPDYATELAKCQRYLRVFESLPNGYITAGGTNFISYIPALSSMRSNPTIVLENLSIALRLPSGYSTLASFDKPLQIVNNVYVVSTRFYLISNEAFGENNVPASVEFRSGRIIFSSEL